MKFHADYIIKVQLIVLIASGSQVGNSVMDSKCLVRYWQLCTCMCVNLELANMAGLAVQQVQQICLSLPYPVPGERKEPHTWLLSGCSGPRSRSSYLHNKHGTRQVTPQPCFSLINRSCVVTTALSSCGRLPCCPETTISLQSLTTSGS